MIERYHPPAPIDNPAGLIAAARGRGVVDVELGNTVVRVHCTRDVIDIQAKHTHDGFLIPVHMAAATNRSAEQFQLPECSRVLHLAVGTTLRNKLSPEAQSGFRAGEFVKAAVAEFDQQGVPIDYCEARWIAGTNHSAFMQARKQGYSATEAAASTWTARQLADCGFSHLPEDVKTVKHRSGYDSSIAVYALFRRLELSDR